MTESPADAPIESEFDGAPLGPDDVREGFMQAWASWQAQVAAATPEDLPYVGLTHALRELLESRVDQPEHEPDQQGDQAIQ